ncbi:1-aminocyclopropane-1-carboxylate deaminase/D-cysteine desulfhydrase [Agathobaculum sp.]|uniref:1-aminocyclopropane-1-carboxylate deaminase/D-cysteine desulfhydrase n=1 Tax=Agathobaculum sp. TaxID=2048138 RepID=UPI002A823068|nr:pyridoxal-phosphate dependent enzyme [Agathobaculum sp.]MDY3619530.1 pyridoxal-phosphate dependent enzyme [Agathobaculum sp.]
MKFSSIPRRGYVQQPTPLQKLPRFSEALGGAELWIKRDDLLPFGGNKLRKMDYLMEQAVQAGADTLITASTNQCCHNGILLLLGNREGMKTQVIMEAWGDPSYRFEQSPEHALYRLAGVERVETVTELPAGPVENMPLAQRMAEEARAKGRTVYFMPRGGAGALGSCGYVGAALELAEQWGEAAPDAVVCPCGLGGTQAGLTVGLHMLGSKTRVIGIGVTGKSEAEMCASVRAQCDELTAFLGLPPVPEAAVRCVDGYAGGGYAKPSAEQYKAMQLLAQTEGVLTDPVYSGKALYGLAGLVRSGELPAGSRAVLVHTGGMNLYYDYQSFAPFEKG